MNCHPVFGCRGHSHPNMDSELTNILVESIVLTMVDDIKTEFNDEVDVLSAKDIQLDNKIDAAVQTFDITTGSLQDQITDLVPTRDAYTIAVDSGYDGTEAEWLASLKGDKGLKGDTGARGPIGPKGDDGLDGAIGKTGPKGDRGLTGDIGPKGDKGDKGATGNIGPMGPIGDTGPRGLKGDKGDTGDRGPTGLTGPKGDIGPRGLPGKDGETGAQGSIGPMGFKGDEGDSAYEVAVTNGFIGTKTEWLKYIKGKSTYELSVDAGFIGSERTWLSGIVNDTVLMNNLNKDLLSIDKAANGDINTTVVTRTGETYPSAKKAISDGIDSLFENGGLPATPFKTKALMTASALANGKYAMVTDDNIADNGLYIKTAGVWNRSKYDVTNLADDRVSHFYKSVINPPLEYEPTIEETYRFDLNVFSDFDDPKLLSGLVFQGVYYPNYADRKAAEFIIPTGATHVKKYNFSANSYLIYIDENGRTLGGGMSSTSDNLALPIGTYAVRFTVFYNNPANNLDLTVDYVEFIKRPLLSYDTILRKSNALSIIKRLGYIPQEYKFSSMPAFSTAIPLAEAMSNVRNEVEIINGYTTPNGGVKPREDSYTVKIPVPENTKEFYLRGNVSGYVYTTDASLTVTSSTLTSATANIDGINEYIKVPEDTKFIVYNVQNLGSTIDKENGKVVFLKDAETELNLTNILEQMADRGEITIGNKLYTFVGDNYQIFRGSVFSGYHPTENFSIEFTGTALSRNSDVGRYCTISNAGHLTTKVYDVNRTLVDQKTVQVFKKEMPTALNRPHSASNKLQVLFIGDSLFHNNANAIGAEWLRMINTDSAATTTGNVIYPQGYNIGKGDIELVGRLGSGGVKYEIANSLAIAMTSTNTSTSTSGNPFYNPNSTETNSIGEDGWHNRVDLVWYFQSICGVGKYPAYIYLACGVNDIAGNGWDLNKLPIFHENYKALLARIKSACDTIAGGESSVQILAVNHQFYPIDEGSLFAFSPQLQRMNYAIHYKEYERMINEDTVDGIKLSSYVRYIDCSSAFDTEYGYAYRTGTVNARQTDPARYIIDMVHIGLGGSAMYADGLLRDFLYHECN